MAPDEIEDLEVETLSWVEEVRRKSYNASAGQMAQACFASLPLPIKAPRGRSLVSVFLYPYAAAQEPRSYRVFEPVIQVTLDATKMEAVEVSRLRGAVDVQTERALSFDKNAAARNLSLRDWDSLNFEFFALYEDTLDQYPRDDLDEDEKTRLYRFHELFCFLVPFGLLPFYEKLNPDFFSWLKTTTGKSLTPVANPPLRRSEGDQKGAAEVAAEQVSQPAKIELTDHLLEGVLDELKLTPSTVSPLADLQPRPNKTGLSPLLYQFPDWPPENWRRVFQTLCKPEWEIVVVFSHQGFAAKTNLFDGDDPDRAYWIRCTQQIPDDDAGSRIGSRLISFPHDPEGVKQSVMSGLQATSVNVAEQTVHTFSPPEFMTVLALADFYATGPASNPAKMMKPFTADDLIKLWLTTDEASEFGWCATAKIVSPVILPSPEGGIPKGLELLKPREFLKQEADGLKATPKLRALLRSLRRPSAFVSVQVNHYGDDTITTQGFAGMRTDSQIWLWEVRETVELNEHSDNVSVNMFQVTNRQLIAVLDSFLGTGARSE
jgi:hypothetical protein